MPENRPTATDPLDGIKLLGAWCFVGIPAAWGIWKVVNTALILFK
jgi:hypothetical protein